MKQVQLKIQYLPGMIYPNKFYIRYNEDKVNLHDSLSNCIVIISDIIIRHSYKVLEPNYNMLSNQQGVGEERWDIFVFNIKHNCTVFCRIVD